MLTSPHRFAAHFVAVLPSTNLLGGALGRRTAIVLCVLAAVAVAATFLQPPASSASELAEALLRHELESPNSYLATNLDYQPPHYLTLLKGRNPADPSPELIAHLASSRFQLLPGSAGHQGQGTHIYIQSPVAMGIGFYRVGHNYSCGPLCGSFNTAIMFYDTRHWHFISTKMTSIS
jgi:hypothetical protein